MISCAQWAGVLSSFWAHGLSLDAIPESNNIAIHILCEKKEEKKQTINRVPYI